ncbi:zinc-dependent metalloprotease family protein [Marinicella sp. W31]|uniref:zinc-dependent metalloprotease family protein n=1 Tax=Marinicella sp. W31 TaxID=3023713 RepID=UPI0037570178
MKRYLSLYTLLMGLLVLPAITEAQLDDVLFLTDPNVKSKQDAHIPITGSTQEWDILFNFDLIDEKRKYFSLQLPGSKETLQAVQTHFQHYEYGTQWAGKIVSDNGFDSGDVILNKVNDHIFGIINTNVATYDIYTDTRVGTRLAQIEPGSYFEGDTVEHDDTWAEAKQQPLENVIEKRANTYKNALPISTVDILVVFDTELIGNISAVAKIQSSFMTANYILQNSGANAVDNQTDVSGGVPLRLNMVGQPVFLNIPDSYEKIYKNNTSFNALTQGQTEISFALKEALVDSVADYVVVYTDFTPTAQEDTVCGKGRVPNTSAQERDFSYSLTQNSINCSLSQYVLLHELMHNFGARHDSNPGDSTIPFKTYARGINISETKDHGPFSTIMAGCVVPTPGFNPATTNCNRIPKLSSPDDTFQGEGLGVIDTIDNARFLSECDSQTGECRREGVANRQTINADLNFAPIINITSFDQGLNIAATDLYELTANVLDDSLSVQVTWKIETNITNAFPEEVDAGTGTGANNSFVTDAFCEGGTYRVIITALDNNGRRTIKQIIVNVSAATPILTSAQTVYGNRYSIELLGDKFASDATVVVSDPQNDLDDKTYAGNLIYNRNDKVVLGVNMNRLTFPIVEPDYQAALRGSGLCFRVKNDDAESSEICTVRPPWVPQGPFLGSAVESYSAGQDLHPEAYIVKGGGTVLKLLGNSWKKVAYDYNVTANTVLEFDFKSTHQEAEIIGVGVIMSDGSGGNFSQRFWQIHGTQTYGKQNYNNYSGNQTVTYTIPIGETLTGQISHLVFVADEDIRVGQSVVFLSPQLRLQGADEYDDTIDGPRTFTDDVNGQAVSWTDASLNDVVHNLHDQGDVDWTIIYAEDFQVRTELIGGNIQPKISLYKWIAATPNQALGYYTNVTDQLMQTSTNSWVSPIVNLASSSDIYAVKVESPSGQYGADTEYRLIFEPVGGSSAVVSENSIFE